MSKLAPQALKDIQFSTEQFGTPADFDAFLQAIIDTQETLLLGRIGSTTFDSEDAVVSTQVKQAALCLSAAELFKRRINRLSGNIDEGTAILIKTLQTSLKSYQDEAGDIICRLVDAPGATDSGVYAGGVIETASSIDGVRPVWPTNGAIS